MNWPTTSAARAAWASRTLRPGTPDVFGCRAIHGALGPLRAKFPAAPERIFDDLDRILQDLSHIDDSAAKEVRRLCDFLGIICRQTGEIGESKICVAFTPPIVPCAGEGQVRDREETPRRPQAIDERR